MANKTSLCKQWNLTDVQLHISVQSFIKFSDSGPDTSCSTESPTSLFSLTNAVVNISITYIRVFRFFLIVINTALCFFREIGNYIYTLPVINLSQLIFFPFLKCITGRVYIKLEQDICSLLANTILELYRLVPEKASTKTIITLLLIGTNCSTQEENLQLQWVQVWHSVKGDSSIPGQNATSVLTLLSLSQAVKTQMDMEDALRSINLHPPFFRWNWREEAIPPWEWHCSCNNLQKLPST